MIHVCLFLFLFFYICLSKSKREVGYIYIYIDYLLCFFLDRISRNSFLLLFQFVLLMFCFYYIHKISMQKRRKVRKLEIKKNTNYFSEQNEIIRCDLIYQRGRSKSENFFVETVWSKYDIVNLFLSWKRK